MKNNSGFNTIVIDPPWKLPMRGKINVRPNQRTELPYKVMTLQEIKDFPLSDFANVGCHVYCWTTNRMLEDTYEVLRSWDVNKHLVLVACKPSSSAPCMGYQFATEFVLLGFYGKPMQKFKNMGKKNWFMMFNSAGKHSTKPDEFYRLVEEMSPEPYIDIFARHERRGWDVWGDEV